MTRRGDATRARLIEATRNVVREVGYGRASTRAIAHAAGVAEGTIYRHFTDKASLLLATVLEANAPIVALVTALPSRAGEATVEANLVAAAVQLASLRDQIIPFEIALAADPDLAAQRRAAIIAANPGLPAGPPEAIATYLVAEQQLGRVRSDVDAQEIAKVLLGVLFAMSAMPVIDDEDRTPDRVASAVRIVVRGIQPAEQSPGEARAEAGRRRRPVNCGGGPTRGWSSR